MITANFTEFRTQLKKFLDDNNIAYENIDVSEDQLGAQEMIEKHYPAYRH